MKKLILSTFLLFVISGNLLSQINQDWKWQHPFPQGNIIRYVKAVDAQNWIFVGESGTFIKTTNAGLNWSVYTNAGPSYLPYNGQSKALYNGWFFNQNTGIVCGALGYIAKTTNGGQSWDSANTGSTKNLYGIHFINSNTGYVCGSTATLFKTTNQGLNWNTVTVTGFTTTMYNVFALDENYIYTSLSNGRVGYTTDGGTTWTSIVTGLSFAQDVNFLDINTGFVCGGSGKVSFTTNGGLNWTANNIPTPSTTTLYQITPVTSSGTPTPYSEGFETTVPPLGWQAVNVAGSIVWQVGYFAHTGLQAAICAWQTPGPGEDWLITPRWNIQAGDSLVFWMRPFYVGYPPDSLAVRVSTTDSNLTSFTTRIYYMAEGNGYPSTPTYQRFAVSLNQFAGQGIFIAFRHGDNSGDGIFLDDISIARQVTPTTIYVNGDPLNIYKRTLTDTTWIPISFTGPTQSLTSQYYSLSMSGNTWVTAGIHGLINVSTNAGSNWTDRTFLISLGNRNDIWAESATGKAITVGFTGSAGLIFDQVMITTNGGTNWALANINSWAGFKSISMINSTTGYICGSIGAVRRTTNGGFNWDSVATGIPASENLYKVAFVNASTGWVFSNTANASGTIWKTTNGGLNWAQSILTGESGDTARIYGASMINASTGWLINYRPRPYKTTDGGNTWVRQDNNTGSWPTTYLYGIQMLDASTGYTVGSSPYIYKTTNGGSNWTYLSLPFSTDYYSLYFTNANTGMVTGYGGLVAMTTNGGLNWTAQNVNDGSMYSCILFSNGNNYAVGWGQTLPHASIFKNSNIISGNITYTGNVPDKYSLDQNYPNPFNPTTLIRFALPKSGNVTLLVYDVTGRMVATLFNNTPLNAGSFEYKFDGSNLASGAYFYKLSIDGNQVAVKKMMLIK